MKILENWDIESIENIWEEQNLIDRIAWGVLPVGHVVVHPGLLAGGVPGLHVGGVLLIGEASVHLPGLLHRLLVDLRQEMFVKDVKIDQEEVEWE